MVGGVSGCRYAVGAEMVSAVSTVMFVTTILAEAGFVQVKVTWPSDCGMAVQRVLALGGLVSLRLSIAYRST